MKKRLIKKIKTRMMEVYIKKHSEIVKLTLNHLNSFQVHNRKMKCVNCPMCEAGHKPKIWRKENE